MAIRIIKGEGSFEFHGALEGEQENLTVTHPKKKEKELKVDNRNPLGQRLEKGVQIYNHTCTG